MKLNTYIVDTFTSLSFKGNPTGVCYATEEVNSELMLLIASELNFPVTAFIKKSSNSIDDYCIRYFTYTTEIPACGHATLASAKVIFENTLCETIKFTTINNVVIKVCKEGSFISMTYPKYSLVSDDIDEQVLKSLNIDKYKSAGYCRELEALFIELDDPFILETIQPNYVDLVNSISVIKEVVITSISNNPQYDYFLRSFCPWIGIDEDPVTGSVHSVLAGFWEDKLNKNLLKAYQASARGGELIVKAFIDKVELSGNAIIILRGEINL